MNKNHTMLTKRSDLAVDDSRYGLFFGVAFFLSVPLFLGADTPIELWDSSVPLPERVEDIPPLPYAEYSFVLWVLPEWAWPPAYFGVQDRFGRRFPTEHDFPLLSREMNWISPFSRFGSTPNRGRSIPMRCAIMRW